MANPEAFGPFLLSYLPLFLLFLPSMGDTDPGDAAAMAAMAKSVTPLPSRWSTDPNQDPCGDRWEGVSCASGRVTGIDLRGASLQGEVPPDVGKLSSLQTLALQKNQLGGDLPTLAGLANLRELYLDQNGFASLPKTFFSGLAGLVNVSLDYNPLAPWSLPGDLSQCTNLERFSAVNASIVGEIPDLFGGLASLQSLWLSYNYLAGVLPTSLGSSGIQELYLNNQLLNSSSATVQLSGTLDVLQSMVQLSVVWLHSNNFTGPIPDLSECTSLVDLQLRDNQLTGVVPPSVASLPSLKNIDLANNLLQGPFPSLGNGAVVDASRRNSFCNPHPGPCDQRVTDLLEVAQGFGYPVSFAMAWKGNNPCNGWMFVSCDAQGNITTLNFGGQNLVGNISDSIGDFAALKVLKLEGNLLTGILPLSLTRLTQLQVLDVSNNNLTGDIPTFGPNVQVSTEGNPLLGTHTGSGISGSTADGSRSKGLGGYMVLIVSCVLVVVVGSAFLWCKKRKNCLEGFGRVEAYIPPMDPVELGMGGLNGNVSGELANAYLVETENMYVPIQDLLWATNNFSEENILGSGGFGIVYKGEQRDGTLIAVKRMECSGMGNNGIGEFKAEIEVLKKVRHRHLVALLGYCEHGSEKLLVYEYMPRGTLEQHLFRDNGSVYPPLAWKQRLTVALDVARGLEYLNSLAQTSFIHRDLKPSNILLDNDMRAKVSDFGLVKLTPDGKNSVDTRLAGTFGYLAPEYVATGRVTTKVDVFAFGVVLMELITGRKTFDDSLPAESVHLVPWFRRALINRVNIRNIVDASLVLDGENLNSISIAAELASHCTSQEAHQRPDMGHAVAVLIPLVGQWKPSCSNEGNAHNVGFEETSSQGL